MTRFVVICPSSFAPKWTLLRLGPTLNNLESSGILGLSLKAISAFQYLCQRSSVYRERAKSFWHTHRIVILYITGLGPHAFDAKSSHLVNIILWEAIEMDDVSHWLSTMGGAYSNLGEHSKDFAAKAGENALRQMRIALRSSDPSVIMKCWLFLAMSLMQLGRFRRAKAVIRSVKRFNNARGSLVDQRVTNMCLGIWSRLQFHYKLRQERQTRPGITAAPQ